MSITLYWHDYETFGVDPRRDRPTQFAGLRTDEALNEVGELLIREKIPDGYLKSALTNEIQDSDLVRMLGEDLRKEFGTPDEISSPEIKLQYKDIAYETIHKDGFKEALERAGIPERSLAQLFSEYDAAPETYGESC